MNRYEPIAPPSPAVVSLEAFSVRRMTANDAAASLEIVLAGEHPHLFDVPTSLEGCRALIERTAAQPWGIPLLCLRSGAPVGWVVTGLTNLRALNAFILGVFLDPSEATPALAICIRHLFWNFPLHRLYTQFPLIPGASAYQDLYKSTGFIHEGVMVGHALVDGRPTDVAVLGLLRDEFWSWAAAHEPRVNL